MPEHIPAFARKEFLDRAKVDPRTFVIIGDTEAALSAVDCLRTNFTGRIILVPTSPYGGFENHDVFRRKFDSIEKNEAFLVEDDFFDRANVDIVTGKVKRIDVTKKTVTIIG